MARPEKRGLSYYNIDTDIFQNRKIRRILKHYGANGYLIYSYVLTEIYRDKGCFIEWDEDTAFDVSDYLSVKENLVNEVINYCCSVGLFNKELLASESVLTNVKIQEFWSKVVNSAGRKITEIEDNFNLLEKVSTLKNVVSTPKDMESTPKSKESTQIKRKEIKGNKKKVNKNIEEREKRFKELVFKNTIHSTDLLKKFFLHWSEKDIDGKKMRFELQQTFDVNRRITRWKDQADEWAKNKQVKAEKNTKAEKINRQSHDEIVRNSTGWNIQLPSN